MYIACLPRTKFPLLRICALLNAAFAMAAIQPAAAQNMATPGSFSVGQNGAARFTVPIKVPAAAGGLNPEIALVYDSHLQGGGLMGQGWTIQGLPKITICPRTFAQDGVNEGAAYNLNDRYCLDGERLIAVKGTYGTDLTEYRTERDTFARIVSYGAYKQLAYPFTSWPEPDHFVVQTKDGRTMEFGNSSDSQMKSLSPYAEASMLRGWALNKVSDVVGNYYTVLYSNVSNYNVSAATKRDDGVFYPTSVEFSAHSSGSAAKYYIEFSYTGNGGDQLMYSGGRPVFSDRMLMGVTVANRNPNVSVVPITYTITYVTDARPSSKDEPRVASIQEYQPPGGSLLPIKFTWDTEAAYIPFASTTVDSAFPGTAGDYDDYFVDANGDGKKYWLRISRASDDAWVGSAGANGVFTAASWSRLAQSVGRGNDYVHLFADVDGDGKTDWIRVSKSANAGDVAKGLGQGAFQFWTASNLAVGAASQYDHMLADLDGDGRADWIRTSKVADEISMARSLGSANFDFWTKTVSHGISGVTWKHTAADLTGTGKRDLVSTGCKANTFVTRHFNLNGFVGGWAAAVTCDDKDRVLLADVNGDGIADLVRVSPPDPEGQTSSDQTRGAIGVALGDGNHTFVGPWTQRAYFLWRPENESMMMDTRGDGIQNLVMLHNAYNVWQMTDSADSWRLVDHQRSPIIEQNIPAAPRGTANNFAADLNGDGMEDIVETTRGANTASIRFANGRLPKRIASIDTGLGNIINITYRPLSDPSVYTPDTDSVFPVLDAKGTRIDRILPGQSRMQRSMLVVSNVGSSNGIGGTQNTAYTYGGLKGELSGHSLLGFRWLKSTQVESGISNETRYRQDWPFTGLVASSTLATSTGIQLKQTTNTYDCNDFVSTSGCTPAIGRRYFPYLKQSSVASRELNDTALPTSTSTMQYDSFGNAIHVVNSTSDGYTKTTDSVFMNDTTKWWIGRPTRVTVTNSTQ